MFQKSLIVLLGSWFLLHLHLVSLARKVSSSRSFMQMTRMFGVDNDFGEDDILGKLEGMKDVIEQVNRQFKDPDLTTFICVCIPEFLSLYETERLVQELTRFEIDTHNIVINQVIFDEEVVESKLLKARMQMQRKYLDQFYVLYDDFNITRLPLLPQEVYYYNRIDAFDVVLPYPALSLSDDVIEQVCGVQALQAFSKHFLTQYEASIQRGSVEEVEQRVSILKGKLQEAESELEIVKKGKQKA